MQALIVSDAYKQTMWIDWISPLYKKVIIRGDFQYLGQYKSAFPLTPSLFQELASKYVCKTNCRITSKLSVDRLQHIVGSAQGR